MRLEGKQVSVKMPNGTERQYEIKYPIKEKDEVYIVGCAGTKDMVPFDNPNAEYWGVNNLWGVPLKGAHWDRWFEIHNIWFDQQQNKLVRRELTDFRGQVIDDYLKGLASLGCPVYMQQFWPELVPNSVPFPKDAMLKWFAEELPLPSGKLGIGWQKARYITNSITVQICFAMYLGFKKIHVWGVDMAVGTEYEKQRPSCEYWMGLADGLGMEISVPDEADLLKTLFIYGLEEPLQDAWTKKLTKVKIDAMNKLAQAERQAEESRRTADQYRGMAMGISEMRKVWSNMMDNIQRSAS